MCIHCKSKLTIDDSKTRCNLSESMWIKKSEETDLWLDYAQINKGKL